MDYRIVSPANVLGRLDAWFQTNLKGDRFFTIFYGLVNLRTRELCYASGGHNPAILLDGSCGITSLDATGPLLGVIENCKFDERCVPPEPGARVLVYSDGVTEAVDAEDEQFGIARLVDMFRDSNDTSLRDVPARLLDAVQTWCAP